MAHREEGDSQRAPGSIVSDAAIVLEAVSLITAFDRIPFSSATSPRKAAIAESSASRSLRAGCAFSSFCFLKRLHGIHDDGDDRLSTANVVTGMKGMMDNHAHKGASITGRTRRRSSLQAS